MAASNSSANLVITYLALTALVVDRRNPRRRTPSQIKQIARSVEAFGFAVPILVDRNNRVVAGHGRFLAAQLLGLVDVPVVAFVSERDSLASRCEA
jgi:ParB-like chromosome segregation protein Spo0J